MSTKKVELWMPLLVDKYLGDTTHLTTEQHGAYILLLMSCWKKDGELPADDTQLRKITGMDPEPWIASRAIVLAFFERDGDVYRQKRLTAELVRAKDNLAQRQAAGKASAEARAARKAAAESNGSATGVATDVPTGSATNPPTGAPTGTPTNGQTHTHTSSEANASAGASAPAGVDKSESAEQAAKRVAWRECGKWLVEGGIAETSARELMGMVLRDWPLVALDAFVAAPKVGTTPDPKAYLIATAKRLNGERNTVPSDAAEKTAEYLAEQHRHAERARSPEAEAARIAAMDRLGRGDKTRAAA